jgi:hypothetical protein
MSSKEKPYSEDNTTGINHEGNSNLEKVQLKKMPPFHKSHSPGTNGRYDENAKLGNRLSSEAFCSLMLSLTVW